ncbi:MAG: FAD-dependent oxidoreductase [Bacteroidetes bacterium]|nr:FAD-dependent oxidoreductase [Bacteroidota bacterium]
MSSIDVLVAGQGIAGTLLARELLNHGLEVLIADPDISPTSSQVAGGLVHPVVPRTGGLTWRAEELFPAVQHYYHAIEEETGRYFYHAMPMAFVADSEQDKFHWKKAAEKLGSHWLEWHDTLPEMTERSGALTRQSARLDVAGLCAHYQQQWMTQGRYLKQEIQWEELEFKNGYWHWGHIRARMLVFCHGAFARGRKPQEVLPFHLTRGELLSIRVSNPQHMPSYIVKKKVFSIPLGGGVYRIGSTYDWNNLTPEPTEIGRESLLQHFCDLVPDAGSFEIIAHDSAIRPTVGRRRPFMGQHPEFPQLFICNGWGSKGASLAAVLIPELVSCMLHGTPVHPETDIAVYWKK